VEEEQVEVVGVWTADWGRIPRRTEMYCRWV